LTGRRLEWNEDDSERDDLPATASVEDVVLDRLSLGAALAKLSAVHREVLDLVFVQGFRLDEVAVIVSVPLGTVKSRISYARRALQAQLAADSHTEDGKMRAAEKSAGGTK
jgi:RNA polymerase sigma-70 factor (ECF subfamily)